MVAKTDKKEIEVRIQWKGLNRSDIDDLHNFLRSQERVMHVYSRLIALDAAYDPSIHPKLATIVGFSIGIGSAVGHKALDLAADYIRDWLKNRQTEDAAAEIQIIYGADETVARRVKKPPLPKAQ
jgi:hypothetical protein